MKTIRRSLFFLLVPTSMLFGRQSMIDLKSTERDRVLRAAEQFLKEQPVTIMASSSSRSAGGLHDFFSEGDYWWPDPKNPDGPYIQRDGMTNPDNFVDHRRALVRLSIQVPALTAAYKITGEERYAAHAIRHLKAWFVDEATKMNPHLKFAQAIKGKVTGRGVGIIDTIHLIEVAKAVAVLQTSKSMDPNDAVSTKQWFSDYLKWMTTHEYGLQEREAKNNHGTCWVMQVAAFAGLAGDTVTLEYCRRRFKEVLLPNQMAADGSFPLELARTKPYGYSLFNLDAMATVCQLLSTSDDNLWEFALPDGRGMRKAVAFMYPFVENKASWTHPQDVMFYQFWPVRQPFLLFAGVEFSENKYLDLWKKLDGDPTNEEIIRNMPVRQPVLWYQE
ncbi:MAG: alginate lyase family protein [Bacteroidota bacterium]